MAEYQGLKMISNINITIANLIREKYHHQAMAEYRGRRGEDLALNHFVNSIVVEEQVLIIMIMIMTIKVIIIILIVRVIIMIMMIIMMIILSTQSRSRSRLPR